MPCELHSSCSTINGLVIDGLRRNKKKKFTASDLVARALICFPFAQIPNGLGVMFAVAQLVLYAMYYKSTQRQVEAKKRKAELGLTEVVVVKGDANKIVSVPINGGSNAENRDM